MSSAPQKPVAPSGPPFLAVLRVNLAIAALLFVGATLSFAIFTGRMNNHFAELARRQHLGTVVLANVKTLPAYLVLAAAYTLLGHSLLHALARLRRGPATARGGAAAVLAANALIFALSLGPLVGQNPGLLDVAVRYGGRLIDRLDPHVLMRYHLLDALGVGFGLLVLQAALFYGGRLLRALRGRLRVAVAVSVACCTCAAAAVNMNRAATSSVRTTATGHEPPNILILATDSLRADHLSGHGYHRPTTPRLDRFATESSDFLNMHVSAASTLESWLSFMHSQFPHTHGIRYMFPTREMVERASQNPDSLPRVLRQHGYYTAVVSNWAGNCFRQVDMGVEHNRAADVQNLDVFIAEAVLRMHAVVTVHFNNQLGRLLLPDMQQVVSYLDPKLLSRQLRDEMEQAGSEGRPFFGVLFLSSTHLPFLSSWPYNVMFADPAYRGPHRYQIEFGVDRLIQRDLDERPPPEQVQHIIDLYDGAVREFDDTAGDILDELRRSGRLRNTLVIVTSDHGEDLYEKYTSLGHGTNFFSGDQSTRIPFIVHLPESSGVSAPGRRIDRVTRSIDIAPTILDLAGLGGAIPPSYQGVSLRPYLDGSRDDLGLPAFAETCYLFFPKRGPGLPHERLAPMDETLWVDPAFRNQFVLKERYHRLVVDGKDRMMRTDRWKLIEVPYSTGPLYRFYDMQADPTEEHDLSPQGGPVFECMKRDLSRYFRGAADLRWPRGADTDPAAFATDGSGCP